MLMKKIKIFWIVAVILMMIPVELMAASYWSGKDVYNTDYLGFWGVTADKIAKVEEPGNVYSIEDISEYSAFMTNNEELVGNTMNQAFWWYNTSRITYVKLINVERYSKVSFVFEKDFYLYCAQFDADFKLIDDGQWKTTGDVCTFLPETKWIMVVFRRVNGDISVGAGSDTVISSDDIDNLKYKYLVFQPFTYTFNLNGGEYNGVTGTYTAERLGVESMALPVPERKGYTFKGWQDSTGAIYSGTLKPEYVAELFKNKQFNAVWAENMPDSVKLSNDYIILEQNSPEVKQLTAEVGPDDIPDKTVIWSSSDVTVAYVDENGKITAGHSGTAVITAKTKNGIEAHCTVYVMGFQVSVPAYCTLNQSYEIKIDVYNNGNSQMNGRKRVIVDADNEAVIYRKGDDTTAYNVLAECAESYNGQYKRLNTGEYLADTMESATIYYRLKPEKDITRAGDYTGSVNFSVIVR